MNDCVSKSEEISLSGLCHWNVYVREKFYYPYPILEVSNCSFYNDAIYFGAL